MKPYCVNLSTIFTEVPFLQRFKKARNAGFTSVECQFPYDFSIREIAHELIVNQLNLVLINLPPGDWGGGERGISILADRKDEFRESVQKGIQYAKGLGVKKIHCLAGVLSPTMDPNVAHQTYVENLQYVAEELERENMILLIEPINRGDMPGYFLSCIEQGMRIIEEVNRPNCKLQFDFYHIQRIQGNLLASFEKYRNHIQHIQIADVPGRHEPGTGEINYPLIIKEVQKLGYSGYIGLEYTPLAKSEDSFKWLQRLEGEDKR